MGEKAVRPIIAQIAEGLNHLNEHNAMHRDLKLDNILLNFPGYKGTGVAPDSFVEEFDIETDELEVIIGDLGFARNLGAKDLATSYCGTPLNMAPEIMNGGLYDSKVDIWSLGTMMYEMLVGFAPFTGYDPHDLADRVNKGDYGIPKNIRLSLQWVDLFNKCLQHDPSKRICHADILEHPFLKDFDETEEIDLSVSRGPGQLSFFEAPSDVTSLNNDNAVMFNAADSWLFNQHYNKSLKKFAEKKQEGFEIIKEPEIPEDVSVNNLQDAIEVNHEENEDWKYSENISKDTNERKNSGLEENKAQPIDSKKKSKNRSESENSREEFKLIDDSVQNDSGDFKNNLKKINPDENNTPERQEDLPSKINREDVEKLPPKKEFNNFQSIDNPREKNEEKKIIEEPLKIEKEEKVKEESLIVKDEKEAPIQKEENIIVEKKDSNSQEEKVIEEPADVSNINVNQDPSINSEKDLNPFLSEMEEDQPSLVAEDAVPKEEEDKENVEVVEDKPDIENKVEETKEEEEPEGFQNMSEEQKAKTSELLAKLDIEEPEEEVIVHEENENKEDLDECEGSDSEPEPIDFTIVRKEDLEDIPEVDEKFEIANSIQNSRTVESSEAAGEEGNNLDSSFEIVHYHDIYMLPDGESN